MAGSAIITGNRVVAAGLTSSSEDSLFPLENLVDQVAAKVFKWGSAGAGWVQADLGSIVSFDTLALINHTFTAGTVLAVKYGNTDPPSSVVSPAPAYRARSIWAALGSLSARYIRIEHNDGGTPQLGELVVCTRTALPRGHRYGKTVGKTRADIVHETQAGVTYAYGLSEREARNYRWRILEAELANFTALDDAVKGRLHPYVFIPNTAAAEVLYVRNEQADFRPQQLEEPMDPSAYEVDLVIREEAFGVLLSA